MNLQQLRYVTLLAQERHFHRAAVLANVTQPTLSQQIKKLEQELGTPLFERSPRGVRLTPAGERFTPRARAILDQANEAVGDLKKAKGVIGGTVSIGVIPTICPYFMPPIIKRLRKEVPSLQLKLYEETTSVLMEHLKSGKLELGLLALPVKDRGIASLSILKETFLLAVSKTHRLAKRSTVSVNDISRERLLILQEGHCFRSQSLEFCKKADKDPQVIFQGSSLTSVMRLVASGEGVTLVPKMAAESSLHPSLRFIRFRAPEPSRELGLLWRLSAPLSAAHDKLIEIIRSQAC